MKIYAGETALKGVTLHTDSDDATMKASDLQQGITAYAGGRKITGSGKVFSFALYGDMSSNVTIPIPISEINTVLVSAVDYPVQMTKTALELQALNFSTAQEVAVITVDGTGYPITVMSASNMFKIACAKTIPLQIMFGKDEYT